MKRTDNVSVWFERKERANGEKYWAKSDACPEVVSDAICEAHDGMLPNDWVYRACAEAVQNMDESGGYDEEEAHEFADCVVDTYTSNLFSWGADFCNSNLYATAEDASNDCGDGWTDVDSRKQVISDRIARIQYFAAERIYHVIGAAYAEATNEV